MPDYEPNVDAPATYWAGEYDAQAIADATGASWAAPLFALHQPRIINIADLCSAPPPSAPVFTTTDLVLSMNIFADNTALRQKLSDYVDAGLHRSFCTAVDVPPLPPMPSNPPPADLPPGPAPLTPDAEKGKKMFAWMEWMVRNFMPRRYWIGGEVECSGTGHLDFDMREEGEWPTWPYGVKITITEKPEYAGRSNGGDFPVFYDLGWFSLDTQGAAHAPVRLAHTSQMEIDVLTRVTGMYYNLPPGVTIDVAGVYPETSTPPYGG